MAKFLIIRNAIFRDVIGLFSLALSIFLGISLVSFHHADPSLFIVGSSGTVLNYGGIVGATLARGLLSYLGLISFVIPPLCLVGAVHFFKKEGIRYLGYDLVCGLLIALSAMSILELIFGEKGVFYSDTIHAGGLIGLTLAQLFKGLFNTAGAFVFLSLSLALFLILLLGISMGDVVKSISALLSSLARIIGRFVRWMILYVSNAPEAAEEATEKDPKAPLDRKDRTIRDDAPPEPDAVLVIKAPQKKEAVAEKQERGRAPMEYTPPAGGYQLPPIDLLARSETEGPSVDRDGLVTTARNLENKLADFGVRGRVTEVRPGPIITLFEFEPVAGERINKIAALADDIAMAMSAYSVRIIAPIPGKSVVGFEIPNDSRQTVMIRDIIDSERFEQSKSKLSCAIGKDIYGNPMVADLAKMPHLLVAGATGAGKSVCINTMILSILYKATPQEVRFLLIDPKMLELSLYAGIPHLLLPVITDPKQAAIALRWVVEEMERRYRTMAEFGVKNIVGYNAKIETGKVPESREGQDHQSMPLLLVVIDELADLMMTSSKEVEESITRLAHMARAAGIHLVLATQRPSVNVLTGVIKANFPARISFQVSSRVDSRTILDTSGAEHLLGKGDMLFLPPATSKLIRVHGAFVSEEEIGRIVDFVRAQGTPTYEEIDLDREQEPGDGLGDDYDEKFDEAVALIAQTGKASISLVQRHLRIGYNRAARIIEKMEEDGIIGPSDGVKPREVFIHK
ncbi:MAG: DNA translocase FtsK 4TM domain-containing protein [Deltaproteobacteria bacterium]|nr:DNA translocase FtsK 4TM domain-containing protein [Candidatus Zymogenaceae bacterium]